MTVSTVGAILLGWLLGLLSPIIVDRIRTRYREKEVKEGIFTELRDLRLRMAAAAYRFESRFGSFDRKLLNWVISIFEKYKGIPEADRLLESMKKYSVLDDKTLQEIGEHQKAKPGDALGVKKYRIPYLDSNIGELGIFDEPSRAALLDIRAQLDLFNEDIDEARLYHKMTFDLSDSETNHAIACQSLENCYRNLAQKARHIVDRIGKVLPN